MVIRFQKQTVTDYISAIIIFCCVVICVVPKVSAYMNAPLVSLILFIVWAGVNALYRPRIMGMVLYKYGLYLLLLAYLAIFPYIFGLDFVGNRYIALFGFWWGVIVFSYYSLSKKMVILGGAVFCSVPFILYVLYKTIQSELESPWNIRQINTFGTGTISDQLIMSGVGGYAFIYMSVFFALLLFVLFIDAKIKTKVMIGIAMVCFFAVIILSNFLTAFLLLVIGCIIYVTMYASKRNTLLILPLLFIVVLALFFSQEFIIEGMMKLFNEEGRIYRVLANGDRSLYTELLKDRWPYFKISLQSILESPLIGRIPFEGDLINNVYVAISNHSTLLDTCAFFGLPAGLLFLKMTLIPFKDYEVFQQKSLKYTFSITFVLLLLFNNTTDDIAIALTIIVPYWLWFFFRIESQYKDLETGGSNVGNKENG